MHTSSQLKHLVVLAFVSACIVLLFFGIPLRKSQEIKELWNLGHFVLYAFIAYPPVINKYLNRFNIFYRLAFAFIFTIVTAGAIEFIQLFLDRSVSISDIYISLMGSFFSVFIFTKINKYKWITSFIFLCAGSIFFLQASFNFVKSFVPFPITFGLSDSNITSYYSGKANIDYNEITKEINVSFNTDVYSTLKFTDIKKDWTGYEFLSVDLTNLNKEPFRLIFRIHDKHHKFSDYHYLDRYRSRRHINPGRQTININLNQVKNAPINRDMDMQAIEELMLYTYYARENFNIILHSFELR